MSVFWYQVYQARLWEGLLASRGLPSDSTCLLKAEPGNLDIKDANLVFFLSVYLLFPFPTSDYDIIFDFFVDSASLTASLKSATSSWPDKSTCLEIDNVYQATCDIAVNNSERWLISIDLWYKGHIICSLRTYIHVQLSWKILTCHLKKNA